jgi:hypothetical protein
VRLVLVASPGIDAELDVAKAQHVEIKNRDVIWLLEHDAEHSAVVRVTEQQDMEGSAGDAVAMALDILDAEFHDRLLIMAGELEADFGKPAFKFLLAGVEVRVATGGKLFGQLDEA